MKREFIKELLPEIAKEALDAIMAENGKDIERQKQAAEALTAERDDLKARLEEASGKLEGYDPEWKAKAEQAQKDAEAKVAALERRQLLGQQAAAIKFSSESARRAFLADLEAKGLPLSLIHISSPGCWPLPCGRTGGICGRRSSGISPTVCRRACVTAAPRATRAFSC